MPTANSSAATSPPSSGFRIGAVAYNTLADALAAANDGATIVIKPGLYRRQTGVVARNNLKIIGDGALVHLAAEGESAQGKGTLLVRGANTTIENLEFSTAAAPDGNGAGIRLEGLGLVLRHCFFHDNQEGLLTGKIQDCDLLMEFCEFARNGAGDGQTHNFYVGQIRKLTMRGCYSHHGKVGHLGKSRAIENFILACRFSDEGGNASYELEFPSGGKVDIRGCVFEQSETTDNDTIISFGAEKNLLNPQQEFRFYQNTVVNRAGRGRMLQLVTAPTTQDIVDNVFAGVGPPSDSGNTAVALSQLVDAQNMDFRLKQAVKGGHRWAELEYVQPLQVRPRKDLLMGAFTEQAAAPPVAVAVRQKKREKVILNKPQPGQEKAWWAALPGNTWVEVNGTRLDAVQPNPIPPGSIGTEGVVSAWSGAAYDVDGNRLLIFGGGHYDSADNSVYQLTIDTLTWARLTDPSPVDALPPETQYNWSVWDKNKDGKPSARHTYLGLLFLRGKMVLLAGEHSWTFDPQTRLWAQMAVRKYPFCPSAYDAQTQRIFCGIGDWEMHEIDPQSLETVNRYSTQGIGHNANGAHIGQIGRELWVLRGPFDGYAFNFDSRRGRKLQIEAVAANFHWAGSQYINDLGLVRWENVDINASLDGNQNPLGGRLFVVDPQRLSQREYELAGVPAYAPLNGMLGRFRYVAKYRALVLITHARKNMHVVRLA
jgi:hypothetical protein